MKSIIQKFIIATLSVVLIAASATAHSGSCRKDSPQGQCCHAGSELLHCH